MIAARRFVAPGKLMLAGEYSTLVPGGEALALALRGGVEVEATAAEAWELARAETALSWRTGPVPEELRFVHAAWVAALEGLEAPPHRICTRVLGGLGRGRRKPGIGGSASATVAVVAALHAVGGHELGAGEQVLRRALRAHRVAQGGRGSGYDIATVVHGGLVRWRPHADEGQARTLAWPPGLHLLAGYSGGSAPTALQLARVEARVEARPEELQRSVGELVEAFVAADPARVLRAVTACHGSLARWDAVHALGIITPQIAQMVALADRLGAAAKVSGAGAGDSVIALAADPRPLEELAQVWRAAGFEPFVVEMSPEGVREV